MEAEYILDYDVLSVARDTRVYLLARIKAGPAPSAAARRALNLSVVLDRSGSMAGEKLDYVKKAAQFLVQRLGAQDRFSLVTYDNRVAVNIEAGPVVHKDQMNKTIEAITSGGNTNLSGGWLQGCQLVAEGIQEGQVNRVLLLTDGLANEGVTDTNRLGNMARQKREEGVRTTTMGVGLGFNEDLLTRMAAEGGGAFYFIDGPDRAPSIFAEELQDLLNVVSQNLVITLTVSNEVEGIRQLNTYPAEITQRKLVFRLGDLYAEEIKTLLIELSIPALEKLGEIEVARLRFDYDELGQDAVTHRTLELPIRVNVVAEIDFEARKPNEEVIKTALLLQAARARDEAVRHADQGEFQEARDVLSKVADAIHESGLEDEELQTQHDMLREEAVDMDMGPQRYDAYSRKSTTTKSFRAAGSSTRFSTMYSAELHERLKSSRPALERGGPTPTLITWKRKKRDLTSLDSLRIGRAKDNDIVLNDKRVSEYHCQIMRAGDDLILGDISSTNGTFANGGLVSGLFRLSVGDVMTVGSVLFTFK